MTTFSKSVMQSASTIIRKQIKEGNGIPSTLTLKSREGKNVKLSKSEYNGLFEAQNIFIRNHGRLPNYVTLNSKANNPLVMDYQDNSVNCCPTSLSMAIQMLYGYHSETECAKILHTGSSGTDPSNLVAYAPKVGVIATKIARNYTAVKKSTQKNKPVIAHIQTKPATCLGYTGDYGHYILIYDITNDGYYKIADPTKGLKTCKPSIIDKATNGRSINYYTISPK